MSTTPSRRGLSGLEVGLSDGLLAIALLEVDERDLVRFGEALEGPVEGRGALAEDGVARDLLAMRRRKRARPSGVWSLGR